MQDDRFIRRAVKAALLMAAGSSLLYPTFALAQDSSADSKDGVLQAVTVTAQFREQNLQDTPLAITAITAA